MDCYIKEFFFHHSIKARFAKSWFWRDGLSTRQRSQNLVE